MAPHSTLGARFQDLGALPQTPVSPPTGSRVMGEKLPSPPIQGCLVGRQSRTKRLRRSCGRGTPEGPPAFLLDCSDYVLNEGVFCGRRRDGAEYLTDYKLKWQRTGKVSVPICASKWHCPRGWMITPICARSREVN